MYRGAGVAGDRKRVLRCDAKAGKEAGKSAVLLVDGQKMA